MADTKRVISASNPLPVGMGGTGGSSIGTLKTALGVNLVANVAPADLPVSTAASTAISAAITTLIGGAPTGANTLKKLADALALKISPQDLSDGLTGRTTPGQVTTAINSALASLTAGSPGELDTFLEVYNRFLTGDNALTSLTATVGGKVSKASNLSDLADAGAARTNLGLGNSATFATDALPVSNAQNNAISAATTALIGGAAAGSNTLKKLADALALKISAQDLSDGLATRTTPAQVTTTVQSAISALTAGSPSQLDTFLEVYNRFLDSDTVQNNLNTAIGGKVSKASNLSDLADVSAARTNLGLGTAATYATDALPVSSAQSTAINEVSTTLLGGAPTSANTLKKLSDLVNLRATTADLGAALATKSTISHTAAPDANYTALVTDVQIGFAVLSAARTVTLPDVDTFPMGQTLFIADESGSCSDTRRITIRVGTGTSDKIGNQDAIDLGDPYIGVTLRRGAANVWLISR